MSPLNRYEHDALEDSEHSTISIADEMNEAVNEVAAANQQRRKVRFSNVQVREFNRIVGDHPDVRVGVPIALGWEHEDRDAVPLDVYERSHISKGTVRLSSITRKNLLANVFGIPEEEIRTAEVEVQKIREQRVNTLRQSKSSEKTEAAVQSVKRKFRRRFSKEKLLNAMAHSHTYMTMIPQMTVA